MWQHAPFKKPDRHIPVKPFSLSSRSLGRNVAASLTTLLTVAGCSSVNLWPFGGESQGQPRVVPNATQYRCPSGSTFHLRMLESGAAWVIYPGREVRLDKSTAGAARYSNGIANLEINGNEATLNDGPGIAYAGCKPVCSEAGAK